MSNEKKQISEKVEKRYYSSESQKKTTSLDEEEVKEYHAYKSLKEFGYQYNEKGELRSIESNEKFKFRDQDHYDRFGYFVVKEIQSMMCKEPYSMDEVFVPSIESDPFKANIFLSGDFYSNSETLMVVICGSGAVKAGQWARSLCINDNLENGAIFGYLEKAKELGFSSIVLNPNLNSYERPLEKPDTDIKSIDKLITQRMESVLEEEEEEGEELSESVSTIGKKRKLPEINHAFIPIKFNETPYAHVTYVYDNYIAKSPAKKIVIVAHSFGGVLTLDLLDKKKESLSERLSLVTLTDSVHSISKSSTEFSKSFFSDEKKTKNWVTSDKALGEDLGFSKFQGCHLASAGHTVHEFTSSFCKKDLFDFIIKNN